MRLTTLSVEQLRRLRTLLERCDEFDSNRILRALFTDNRLALFGASLPEADNLKSRVDLLIAYLHDKRNTSGQPALVLLLWALTERYNPADERHDNLLALASELTYGVRAILPANSAIDLRLERKIREANSFLDVRAWIAAFEAIERCVCRISVSFGGVVDNGTGFLLAPDIVMTNYHVVERVIIGKIPPASVHLLFDYHIQEDGVTPHVGPSYKLTTLEWMVDASPYSSVDLEDADHLIPESDRLDYVLLRVAGMPGNQQLNVNVVGKQQQESRGWIKLPERQHIFVPNTPLLIAQHPDGKELKLTIDTDAIIGTNSNDTRVRYRANTDPGSSGSPCFDINWNLIALHHGGDRNYEKLYKPQYNQGIPFASIMRLMEERGTFSALRAEAT